MADFVVLFANLHAITGIGSGGKEANRDRPSIELYKSNTQRKTRAEVRLETVIQGNAGNHGAREFSGGIPCQSVRKAGDTVFPWRILGHSARGAALQQKARHALTARSTAAAEQRPRS